MMNEEKMVSVIMGVYKIADRKEMVQRAIQSILNQTYKNLEFIICDDGSDDGSYEIIKNMVMDDERCVVLKQEKNGGLGSALNECINHSKGYYIARMDDDDVSHEQRLEKQICFLEKNPEYAVVGTTVRLFDATGVWGHRAVKEYPQKKDFLIRTQFIHPTVVMRKDVLIELNGYSTEKAMRLAEDYDLFMRLYAAGYKGYNLQKELFDYREDNNAYKRRTYKRRIEEAMVRRKGFKHLGLLPAGYVYVLKPLLGGLIPQRILKYFR